MGLVESNTSPMAGFYFISLAFSDSADKKLKSSMCLCLP